MNDVEWIKLTTDMFSNRKIKYLRKLPEGNNIVMIYIMLLTMAGRCNSGGMIFLTENIPYSPKMLADELDFEESTVQLAINALYNLGMISKMDDYLTISNWEEHQNVEGLEKIREQNRLRKQKYDEKKRLLASNVTSNVTVTCCNATEEDIEEDKEEELEVNKRKRFSPPTVEEVRDYCSERRNNVDASRFVDYYTSNNWMVGRNKMKDWKAAVRTWENNSYDKQPKKKVEYGCGELGAAEMEAIQRALRGG